MYKLNLWGGNYHNESIIITKSLPADEADSYMDRLKWGGKKQEY